MINSFDQGSSNTAPVEYVMMRQCRYEASLWFAPGEMMLKWKGMMLKWKGIGSHSIFGSTNQKTPQTSFSQKIEPLGLA